MTETHKGPRPTVAVVIPTYNDSDRLKRALASVLAQTSPPDVVVVADDGSSDGTAETVRRTSAGSSVEVLYAWGENTGGIGARNRGVSMTDTDWIAMCDSDDLWLPDKLERQMAFIAGWNGRRRLAAVATDGFNVNDRERRISSVRMGPRTESEADELRKQAGLVMCLHSSLVIRRSMFDAVGGYSGEYGAAHDTDLLCRLLDEGSVVSTGQPLTLYRKRADSMQLTGFWNGPLGISRLAENRQRLAAGLPELDIAGYERQRRARGVGSRLDDRRRMAGLFFYRRGAVRIVNRRVVGGGADLLLAAALEPSRVRAGVGAVLSHARGRR